MRKDLRGYIKCPVSYPIGVLRQRLHVPGGGKGYHSDSSVCAAIEEDEGFVFSG